MDDVDPIGQSARLCRDFAVSTSAEPQERHEALSLADRLEAMEGSARRKAAEMLRGVLEWPLCQELLAETLYLWLRRNV